MTRVFFSAAVLLVGCGGEPFSGGLFGAGGDTPDAGGDVDWADPDAMPPEGDAAPEAALGTGGQSSGGASSGGRPEAGGTTSGGASSGGAASGGAPEAGGALGAGGKRPGTGGRSTGGAATGGAPAAGGAPCAVTHHTGTGHTWADCVPAGTHDGAQALAACETWCAVADCTGCFVGSVCGVQMALGTVDKEMHGWAWRGEEAGEVSVIDAVTQTTCDVVGSWD